MRKRKLLVIGGVGFGALVILALASPDTDYPEVRVESVSRRDVSETVIGSGQLQPRRKIDVSADAAGRVVELRVREGSVVRAGEVLLRLDASRYEGYVRRTEAQVNQTLAASEQARITMEQAAAAKRRAEAVASGSGMMATADLDQARTQAAHAVAQFTASTYTIAQARGTLEEARENLAKATIRAPMSGVVTRVNVREGEYGGGNHPDAFFLTIADVSEMEARINVDETDLPRISFGDSAFLRIDAFPRARFSGRVARISNSAVRAGSGQHTNNFEVIISLDQSQIPLHSDLSATAEIVTERRSAVLSVPLLALVVRDRAGRRIAEAPGAGASQPAFEGVFVVEDEVAVFRPVRVGIVGDQYAEVLTGLKQRDVVVAGTYQVLRALEGGADVFVTNPAPTPTPKGP